jgi:ribosomal protein S20
VANIKSQIKRIKTNEKARLRNKSVTSAFKTLFASSATLLHRVTLLQSQQSFAQHQRLSM